MNLSHSGLADWGLTHIEIGTRFTILDVGCRGGRTIQKMAGLATEGMVYGIDFAEGSVAASRAKNAGLIKAGRVDIKQASVSHLPFANASFDLVSAVETHYYWPDMLKDMQEILRVLKPGATFIILAESYHHNSKSNELQRLASKLLNFRELSVDEHREMFLLSDFSDVQMFEERSKGWVCGIGRKPL